MCEIISWIVIHLNVFSQSNIFSLCHITSSFDKDKIKNVFILLF